MDLVSLLSNAANGLAAIQGKVATASNNIANANTPGYARQSANLAEGIPSELAGGRGFIGKRRQHRAAFLLQPHTGRNAHGQRRLGPTASRPRRS